MAAKDEWTLQGLTEIVSFRWPGYCFKTSVPTHCDQSREQAWRRKVFPAQLLRCSSVEQETMLLEAIRRGQWTCLKNCSKN